MSKNNVYTIVAKKVDGEAQEASSVEFGVSNLSVAYVQARLGDEDKFTYNPAVQVFRLVDMSNCQMQERCVYFGETCDKIYLPPGRYSMTTCPITSKYFDNVSDMEIAIDVVVEEVSADYKAAMELNKALGCC